jgi:hypothetical protein
VPKFRVCDSFVCLGYDGLGADGFKDLPDYAITHGADSDYGSETTAFSEVVGATEWNRVVSDHCGGDGVRDWRGNSIDFVGAEWDDGGHGLDAANS